MDDSTVIELAVERANKLLMSQPMAAELILEELLRVCPANEEALRLGGLCKHRLGKHEEAIGFFRRALDLNADDADSHNNLGLVYVAVGLNEAAIACFDRAIAIRPDQAFFVMNRAQPLRRMERFQESEAALLKATQMMESAGILHNLGGLYLEMNEGVKCRDTLLEALRIDPDYLPAHIDLAFAYHYLGDWKKGFEQQEYRFLYYPQMKSYLDRYDQTKRWDGKADLQGKRILLYCEQGLGDAIQFIRFAADLKRLGAHVIAHCAKSLVRMFERVDGVAETFVCNFAAEEEGELPPYDYQFSLMSAPYLLGLDRIDPSPYITPKNPTFRDQVEHVYPGSFRVAINWAGSVVHPHDRKRSIPLRHFNELFKIEGAKFFSLQMDRRPRQYGVRFEHDAGAEFAPTEEIVDFMEGADVSQLIDLSHLIEDFDDTTTALSGMDLVISCDTSTVVLGGAMGIPTFDALTFNPDWRWGLDRTDTYWHESVRLFRQPTPGDWDSVFQSIEREVRRMVAEKANKGA